MVNMALTLASEVNKQKGPVVQASFRTRQKHYTLDIEKSLAKKLEATKRNVALEYQMTGGGLKGIMDAASYELMKKAMIQYYTDFPEGRGFARIDNDIDQKGSVTANVIRVSNSESHLYTINLYLTKCSFLVNGKNVDEFLSTDIPCIHELASNVRLDGKVIDLKMLNQLMAKQLQQAIEARSGNCDPSRLKCPKSVTDKDNECFKCKRNLKSRATWCDKGEHWIHYNCERLTEDEIRKIQAEPDSKAYTCKLCKAESVNNHCSIVSTNSKASTQITLPKTPHLSDINSILQDELLDSENNCQVCDSIIHDLGVSCSDCKMTCHVSCSMNTEEETVCLNCCALIDKTQQEEVNNIDSSVTEQLSEAPETQSELNRNVQGVNCAGTMTLESNYKNTPIQMLGCNTSENVSQVNVVQTPISTITHESTPNNTKNAHDVVIDPKIAKQSEIRQREQKLRKKEEELKIKEKVHSELQEERIWFKSYINKLEIRVNELEKSNQMLRNQLKTSDQNENSPKVNNIQSPGATSIMDRIQNRVTTMILNQVDRQFNKVESILDSIENGVPGQNQTLINPNTETISHLNPGTPVNHNGLHVTNLKCDKAGQSEINPVAHPIVSAPNTVALNGESDCVITKITPSYVKPPTGTAVGTENSVSSQFAAICDETYVCNRYPQAPSTPRPKGLVKSSATKQKKHHPISSPNQLHENVKTRQIQRTLNVEKQPQNIETTQQSTTNNFLYRIPQRRISM